MIDYAEVPSQIRLFVELQRRLDEIDVGENVVEWIKSNFEGEYYEEVANNICRFAERRPKLNALYSDLCAGLCSVFGSGFAAALLHTADLSSASLVRRLFFRNVFTKAQIVRKCMSNKNMFLLFAPKITARDIEIEDKAAERTLRERLMMFEKDNWRTYLDLAENSYAVGSFAYGIRSDDVELVKAKLQWGDIPMSLFDGFSTTSLSPMEFAAYYGSENAFCFFALNCGVDICNADLIKCAVMGGNDKIITLLRLKGASFEGCLSIAARFMRFKIAEELISCYGVDGTDMFNYGGNYAVFMRIMQETNADLRMKNQEKQSLLHIVAQFSSLSLTKYLIAVGVHPLAEDIYRSSVLHEAAKNGSYMIAKYLIYKGADTNCIANNGFSPLHFAAAANQLQLCQLLVNNGANPNYRDPVNNLAASDVTTDEEVKRYLARKE